MNPCERATADFEVPLQIFAYFLGTERAIYVSAPITSGRRFLAWYKAKGRALKDRTSYSDVHKRDVIAVNRQHVAATVAALKRREDPTLVLDPTSLDVPGWSQHDYRCFWGKVIRRFGSRVIFLDGWEASVGCVYEFDVAMSAGIPTFDERDKPISMPEALSWIQRSADEMANLGLETEIHHAAIQNVRSLGGIGHDMGEHR